jgi:two-component system phosphate regulon sensor histidine kinase PhoR
MWTTLAVLVIAGLAAFHFWERRRWRLTQEDWERTHERWRITEQQLRAEIERDRAGLVAVFDRMIEGLLILGSDRRVQWANLPLQRLFQLTSDVRGRTLMEALQRHELEQLAERARLEGQAPGLELEIAGQPPRFLQVNASIVGRPGEPNPGVILVFHEVTRLKELEATRREFVANVSHELRTPLSLIKGFVETLIDGARHDPEVGLRFLQTIEKHANRLTFLIEDLLTISQLESGSVVLNCQSGEVQPLVDKVLEDLSARADAREIRLRNEVPSNLLIRADFDRLQQVFFNLVDNAIKYGRTGGEVVVGGEPIPGTGEPGVALWVRDDGPGIPREALDRIFERFFRVDAARSREQGGTGLGLSIVKHIVQAHGGEVRAESEVGAGAVFKITIPASSARLRGGSGN